MPDKEYFEGICPYTDMKCNDWGFVYLNNNECYMNKEHQLLQKEKE